MHMHNTLESQRIFPIIAWSVVIGFALFVYTLTLQLKAELNSIGDGIQRLEMRLNEIDSKKQAE